MERGGEEEVEEEGGVALETLDMGRKGKGDEGRFQG